MANYYNRWIGDFSRDTGHLSCAEVGAYDRLLDHYYATESALPGDIEACERIVRAMSKVERKAVSSVLRQFFVLKNGMYHQRRTDDEIAKLQAQKKTKQENGKAGGRPKKNQTGTNCEPVLAKTETEEKPSRFSVDNLEETYNKSSPITNHHTNKSFVESEGVSDISHSESGEPQKTTHSLTPVDIFPMGLDWSPSVEFEKNLPPDLQLAIPLVLRDLHEFRLYRSGTGERRTQAQWEHLWLKNIEANVRFREAALR